ncbi:hypothetical protein HY489_04245 [Candidatus Woesearchaeota archaeon]|nr:hypothetical protein [Candidatus Woesearchaeota archaeon]
MNQDVFNELIDTLGAVVGTFRSVETFPKQTDILLAMVLQVVGRLKVEVPNPSQEELDAIIELQTGLVEFKDNVSKYGRNLVKARADFKENLRGLLKELDGIAVANPQYGLRLRSLQGYRLLRKLVGV